MNFIGKRFHLNNRIKPVLSFCSREWITNAAVLYFVNQLVENSGSRINKEIASGFDFYIMPMANPDGYVRKSKKNHIFIFQL